MLIRTNKGEKVFLKIEGDTRKEGNWLNVSIDAQLDDIQWKANDKCLQLKEVRALIHWFERIVHHETTIVNPLTFLEPELEFILKSKSNKKVKHIQIILNYNLLPSNRKDELQIEITPSEQELNKIIHALKADIL